MRVGDVYMDNGIGKFDSGCIGGEAFGTFAVSLGSRRYYLCCLSGSSWKYIEAKEVA